MEILTKLKQELMQQKILKLGGIKFRFGKESPLHQNSPSNSEPPPVTVLDDDGTWKVKYADGEKIPYEYHDLAVSAGNVKFLTDKEREKMEDADKPPALENALTNEQHFERLNGTNKTNLWSTFGSQVEGHWK